MKEQVRVLINGPQDDFLAEWNHTHSYKLDSLSVPVLPSNSEILADLRRLAAKHPDMRVTEFVERQYTATELLEFEAFVVWINADIGLESGQLGNVAGQCQACGFKTYACSERPYRLAPRQRVKKDFAETDDWLIVVSQRIASLFSSQGLSGAEQTVLVDRHGETCGAVLHLTTSIDERLPDTLRYEGPVCPACGRVDRGYPLHPSNEVWIPRSLLGGFDIGYLNQGLERTYNNRILISKRFYLLLRGLKASGFWVQPIHQTD